MTSFSTFFTPITRDPDFTYHSDIKSQLEFSPLCSDAVDGQKCRIQPVSGTKCAALSKGGIWLQIDDDVTWVKTKGFECRYDEQEGRLRWTRRDFVKEADREMKQAMPPQFGSYKIRCGDPGCSHPSKVFDQGTVHLKDKGKKGILNDPEANINFNRGGFWSCKDESGKMLSKDAAYVPRGGKCELDCLNTFVPKISAEITCKDNQNENPENEAGDWDGLRKLYNRLHNNKYDKKDEFARMADSEGNRNGWRCYFTQPIYKDWSDWGSCENGERSRTRVCQGTCDDTLKTESC